MDSKKEECARVRLQLLASHLRVNQTSISREACMARRDGRVNYGRPALDDARFMRCASTSQVNQSEEEEDSLLSLPVSALGPTDLVQAADTESAKTGPLFSKPAVRENEQVGAPLFARSAAIVQGDDKENLTLVTEDQSAQPLGECLGFEWFPRMDVVESGTAYVVTVELPGVNVDGIRVEIDHGSLIITGNRSTDWWKSGNGNGGVYHRQELAQGPYRAIWHIPKNGDIGAVTADFIDGFLRVLVPKTKMVRYL
ncbi:unnamed protein product [Sphagnum troendelagicum]|uniref:SHSP domain-containing protein n=1 Tax=Sphagnum troendelagicum TaxID=128251 RepID=A0ABP0TBE5_9BRYO